jgi:hypothetical protein
MDVSTVPAAQIRVPVLRSPFPSRVNKYTAEAERLALRWAEQTGLVTAREATGLGRQRFGLLVGRCHPELGLARLADVCRWYLWFAVLDDRYCDRPGEADRLAGRLAIVSRALAEPPTAPADPVALAAADLGRRTRARASDEQYQRLVAGLHTAFFGLLWERAARDAELAPSPVDYLWMRRFSGALPAFVVVTEIFGGRQPTPDEVARPEPRAVVARVGNLIMWQNDIRSYQVESTKAGSADRRRVLSLPTVLAEAGRPEQAALDMAAKLWHDEVQAYSRDREALMLVESPALRRYCERLHDLLTGFLTWTNETTRYT